MSNLPLTGIVHVTGEHDTGKTTFAYTPGVAPDKIVFFDNDLKGENIHRQVGFSQYYNLVRMFRDRRSVKPLDFHNMVMELVRKLPDGGHEVLVFDNWTQMEEGINTYVDENIASMSNLTPGQAKNMNQLTWPYKRAYYASVLDMLLSKAQLVIITTHLKDKWVGQRRTGQKETRCQQPLVEKASLRLWLVHNPKGQAPIGLVLKRTSKAVYNAESGLIEIHSVLPRKVVPCTWERIRWYYDNPVGNRALGKDEIPDEHDLSILDGVLTADQKMMLELAMRSNEPDPDAEVGFVGAAKEEVDKEEVKRLRGEGKKAPQIAKELGVGVAVVLGVLNES